MSSIKPSEGFSKKERGRSITPSRGRNESTQSQSPSRESSKSSERGRSPNKRDKSPSRGTSKERRKGRSKSRSPSRGRSQSPGKFAEDSFGSKKNISDIKKRQNAIAKVRGLKLEPSEWTKVELVEKISKFAKYNQDKKTGVGELSVEGRRLLTEELSILQEALRRFTEIQIVRMNSCNLTDDILIEMMPWLRNLRHLKTLELVSNQLTTLSIRALIKNFSKLSRKFEVLDVRNNTTLNFIDGSELYSGFTRCKSLNGINLELYCTDYIESTLSLSNLNLKLCEMGIICRLFPSLGNIRQVDLSHNGLNSKCLWHLVDYLPKRPHIQTLDLSHNPLTNEGTDMRGLDSFVSYLRNKTQFIEVSLKGVEHIPHGTTDIITRSLQVNRSINGLSDGYYFNKFITNVIETKTTAREATTKRSTQSDAKALEEWVPKFDTIDRDFVFKNRISSVTVEVTGDEIMLIKKPVAKPMEDKGYKFSY